jgi:arylsulfatase A-like enzyme
MAWLLACRGWANVGYHRAKPTAEVVTPAIDAIVASGIALDRMYAYPYCAPSRAALLSGRLPHHVSSGNIRGATYDGNHSEIGGQGVPRNMTTLSQMLSHAGYWGAFAGKWDCGFVSVLRRTSQSLNRFDSIPEVFTT